MTAAGEPEKTLSVFDQIRALLDENEVAYRVLEHEPAFTSEEAARVRGTELSQAAKALVFRADRKPMLIVVPGDRRVDTEAVKREFGIHNLWFVSPEQVEELTGVRIGAVPPFGSLLGIPTYLDRRVVENDRIVFNAGSHTRSVLMSPADLVALTDPTIGQYSK
jgi:Cys-tRNA(Pro) deacylase